MDVKQQYACRDCDNVSWHPDICHGVPMEPLCFCGSGLLQADCHGVGEEEPRAEQTEIAREE